MCNVIYHPRLAQRGLATALAVQTLTLARLDDIIVVLEGVLAPPGGLSLEANLASCLEAILGSCETTRQSVADVTPTTATAARYIEIFDACLAASYQLLRGMQQVLRDEIERRAAAAGDRPCRPSSVFA